MKRWNLTRNEDVENTTIDDFLTEILAVCRKYNLSLSHEDTQGAFEIEPYNEWYSNWLLDAADCTRDGEISSGEVRENPGDG